MKGILKHFDAARRKSGLVPPSFNVNIKQADSTTTVNTSLPDGGKCKAQARNDKVSFCCALCLLLYYCFEIEWQGVNTEVHSQVNPVLNSAFPCYWEACIKMCKRDLGVVRLLVGAWGHLVSSPCANSCRILWIVAILHSLCRAYWDVLEQKTFYSFKTDQHLREN